jgi:peptidoglycan/xylan/chitin deacetylase (PgdA/CDA1 family)
MYHYVRELESTPYPRIRGRRTSEFRFQIQHFRRNYSPITIAELIHCTRTGDALPPRAILLTFDDGYAEHYQSCFPLLHDAGIQGAFFAPARAVVNGELLDVNRIHFLLAAIDAPRLAEEIDRAVLVNHDHSGLESPASYRARLSTAGSYDDAETMYVKRMLQRELPEDLRGTIARELFSRYVSDDERAFAAELYCTRDQLRTMQSSGMYVGSHGATHSWLNAVDAQTQRLEIDESLAFLRSIGSSVDAGWAMCYPYGAWDNSLLGILRERECAIGFTTAARVAHVRLDDPLLLPRLDTNDFPVE